MSQSTSTAFTKQHCTYNKPSALKPFSTSGLGYIRPGIQQFRSLATNNIE